MSRDVLKLVLALLHLQIKTLDFKNIFSETCCLNHHENETRWNVSLLSCHNQHRQLFGPLRVDLTDRSYGEILRSNPLIRKGGAYEPDDCTPSQNLAILIPYRNRTKNLRVWLSNLHPILQRQALKYRVLLIEQADDLPFNRAALINIGIIEAKKLDADIDCFVFHDVDLIPEDDRNIYKCTAGAATAMSVAASKWNYRLQYPRYAGGVIAIGMAEVTRIGGLANSFFGWGGEDDDLSHRMFPEVSGAAKYSVQQSVCATTGCLLVLSRLKHHRIPIIRNSPVISRYFMLDHDPAKESPKLEAQMRLSRTDSMMEEGIRNVKYSLKSIEELSLFTKISVLLSPPKPVPNLPQERKTWLERAVDSYNSFVIDNVGLQEMEGDIYTDKAAWNVS